MANRDGDASRFKNPDQLRTMLVRIRTKGLALQREWHQVGETVAALKPIDETNAWLDQAKSAISKSELGRFEAARLDTDSWIPIETILYAAITWPEIAGAIGARLLVLQAMSDEISLR
jgi:hypothetical protein